MESRNQQQIKQSSSAYEFYLIEPHCDKDAHKTAIKLMHIPGVKEVHITEGAYGFIVKAEPNGQLAQAQIAKTMRSHNLISHCTYQK